MSFVAAGLKSVRVASGALRLSFRSGLFFSIGLFMIVVLGYAIHGKVPADYIEARLASREIRFALALRPCDSLRLTLRFRGLCRVRPGDAAEYGAVGEAGSARVIEVEDSTHQFSRGIEARDRFSVGRHHLRFGVDAQPAEGEGDPAGDRVGLEGRRVDGVRP